MSRRGGRVVEGARLEFVYAGNRIAGSNPALSAIHRRAERAMARCHGEVNLFDENCLHQMFF